MPNFLIVDNVTSSDINKFLAVQIPVDKDESKTHLILILLSTNIYNFIKFLIFLTEFDIKLIKFKIVTKVYRHLYF